MIYEGFRLPIIEFIERAEEIPNLIGVVLFGSAVTGDVSKKSDIDLMLIFDTDHNPEVGMETETTHKISSEISIKYDLAHPFSFVFVNKRNIEEIDPDFLWNVSKEGILIWGKAEDILMKEPHPSLKPMVLIRYSAIGLRERDRRGLFRRLYAAKHRIVEKKDRLGPGIILIEAERFDGIKNLFDDYKVKYSVKKIWVSL